jgi:hypothetical protein
LSCHLWRRRYLTEKPRLMSRLVAWIGSRCRLRAWSSWLLGRGFRRALVLAFGDRRAPRCEQTAAAVRAVWAASCRWCGGASDPSKLTPRPFGTSGIWRRRAAATLACKAPLETRLFIARGCDVLAEVGDHIKAGGYRRASSQMCSREWSSMRFQYLDVGAVGQLPMGHVGLPAFVGLVAQKVLQEDRGRFCGCGRTKPRRDRIRQMVEVAGTASRPPQTEVSRAGWAAIASAPASSPSFDSSSRSRMINSSVSAETASGLQCGRRDRGSSRSACAKIAT